MDRKNFLKTAGLSVLAGPFLIRGWSANAHKPLKLKTASLFNCILTPSSTRGPFYIDPEFNRQDISEGLPGTPLTLNVQVLGVTNCAPVPNAIVNVWHCNHLGVYSGFGAVNGNPGDGTGQTYYRGYQSTDNNGNCTFATKFPGWYPGRATHIHFDVHIGYVEGGINTTPNATSSVISSMYFPDSIKTRVYTDDATYAANGDNPTGTTNDSIYDGGSSLLTTIDDSNYPASLTANFVIGLDMEGTLGIDEFENANNFNLKQNYPNPFRDKTNINFNLKYPSSVIISIFDLKGELVEQVAQRELPIGEYTMEFDRNKSNLSAGVYLLDMVVNNQKGKFRQSKKLVVY